MGNKIKYSKIFDISVLLASVTLFVYVGLPISTKLLHEYTIDYYTYKQKQPIVSLVDTSKQRSAKAVPILMYHGVLEEEEEANTSIENFIKQMEWLKRNGYETISIAEFDLFRQGKLALPPKPVIITFDDGRKDSYYTTDDILKKLGFKATIFVATAKTIEGESFYLTWDDLRTMKASGRWEIEAHGRHSHEKLQISSKSLDDEYGRYLTSKMYLPAEKRLETQAEFEKRVEEDYTNNIKDLKNNLGVEAKYLAIPLNDYGVTPVSNNPEAAKFNQQIIKKYFRMSFIESNSSENVKSVILPIYNYRSDDAYRLRRLEMKNMDVQTLKYLLEREMPTEPNLNLASDRKDGFLSSANLAYGFMSVNNDGLHLRTLKPNATAKVDFGQAYWDNYELSAKLNKLTGRSISLLMFSKDEKNFISFGITDSSIFLRERYAGVDYTLSPSILLDPKDVGGAHIYSLSFKGGKLYGYFDGRLVYSGISTMNRNPEGGASIKVWSDKNIPEGVVNWLKITPLDTPKTA